MLFQFNTGFYRSVCQISHDLLTVKSHGCPVLQQFFEWDGLTAMEICTSLCDKKLNLVFWLLKGNRLQKVKRGNRCHFLLWLYVQVLQHFLSKRNVAVSPYAHPSILFSSQKLHILPFNLIFLCLSCYTYFFPYSATFFWKWNQDKLENRTKCCNSTSNRHRCALCSGYGRSICPIITVSDWLSLHKETETAGID